MVSVASYTRDKDAFERDVRFEDVLSARHLMSTLIRMSDQHKYRIDIVNDSNAPVTVAEAYFQIAH